MTNIFELAGKIFRMYWPNTRDDGKEYSADEIVAFAAPMLHKGSTRCGIYFLLWMDEIVYVGQSVDVRTRIDQHTVGDERHEVKNFNRYFFIQCEPEELNRLEAYYILKFRPKYNIAVPKAGKYEAI
jgi:excinuclease UvrABC nuclease subunit